jgi:hypothetical protein
MTQTVNLNVVKYYQTAVDFPNGIAVDKIVIGTPLENGNTELQVESQNKTHLMRFEVTETLQEIIDNAVSNGYTEHPLVILPITKINQSPFSPAKNKLLNLGSKLMEIRTIYTNGTATGSRIFYTPQHEKKGIILETSDVLLPQPSPPYS